MRGTSARKGKAKDKSAKADNVKQKNGETLTADAKSKSSVKRIRRRKSNFARIAMGVVFGVAVAFIVASIIHGQVQLTELNQQIADAKEQLAEQQSIYTQLEMKVDSSISTTLVEEYAENELNMSKAANAQKEFVNLSEGDKAEVSLTEEKNIFTSIAQAFASLWS